MELHHGQTVERIIRRNGFNITELARLTKVNRRSVYNWFNQRHLKPQIIYRIGSVISYDFSSEFPGMFSKEDFINKGTSNPSFLSSEETVNSFYWKDKYIELLERHNELLQVYIEK
ncbi:MAG TPA: hypothetical protein VK541_03050 [Pedobacter sp.]|uniref:hypothetical protein n=1 Tax=Pedobacter sp. TaxID=1411316 RepID=UPI002C859CF5|nr:hypothetical protein [Pedobacter sp.]HMI01428.1 hypothetical protein [Pedobacter sp.]